MKNSSEVKWFFPPEQHLSLRTSFFKMYARCPAQALFRYFKGLVILPRSYTTFGTCSHKAAEHQNLYKKKRGSDIRLSVVQDVFNEEFKRRRKYTQWAKDEDPNKILLEGVKKCVPVYHEAAKRFEPLYVEEPFKMFIPEGNFTLTGSLDLVNKNAVIRDLKTRRKAPNWLDPIKSFQKKSYSFGYHSKFKKLPKGFVLDTLVRKTNPEFLTSDMETVGMDEWEPFKQTLLKIVHSVRLGIFYPHEEGNMFCSPNSCGYWSKCHAGDWMKLPKDGKIYMENTPIPKPLTDSEEEELED